MSGPRHGLTRYAHGTKPVKAREVEMWTAGGSVTC